MSSSRGSLRQSRSRARASRASLTDRLAGTLRKDCWLTPGTAMWLFSAFILVAVAYIAVTCTIFDFMFKTQPHPYLDEVFHIPQARRYCDGNFTEWDPKITTLPGLYLLTVGSLKPISWFLSDPDVCFSVYTLRGVNVVLSTGLLYVTYSLLDRIHGHKNDLDVVRGLLTAINMCVFPILYFFNFLYYTDVMSTFLVLFTYLLCLHEHHIMSAFTGCLAVCVRQTNIVWIAFFGLLTFADVLKENAFSSKKKFTSSVLRTYKYLEILWTNTCQVAITNGSAGKALATDMMKKLSGYFCVGAAFISFVFWNGSIVVGDKQAHQASLHLTQLLYFSAFVLFFMFPIAMPYLFTLLDTLRRRALHVVLCSFIILATIHFNTIAHPYLLADNRHYTFYIWRRVINREWYSRYMMTPVYLMGCFFIASILKRTDFVYQLGFVFCLVANIVPQSLLEFRYFIIPYMLLRIQIPKLEIWQLLSEMALYVLVNASTILIFSMKTIKWPDMEEPQRFLW